MLSETELDPFFDEARTEWFRLEALHLKPRAAQGLCGSANGLPGLGCDRGAAVVFEITDSQFPHFRFRRPT